MATETNALLRWRGLRVLRRSADHPVFLGDIVEDDIDRISLRAAYAHQHLGDRLRDLAFLLDRTSFIERDAYDRHLGFLLSLFRLRLKIHILKIDDAVLSVD